MWWASSGRDVVIFDEWFQFRGNPFLGERLAFDEWQARNPDWFVTDYTTQGPWSKAFILSRRPEHGQPS